MQHHSVHKNSTISEMAIFMKLSVK